MSASAQVGDVIAGKFRIEGLLGEGGMGVVFAATHLELGAPVALKLLRAESLDRDELVHRLRREARAAARLRTEHAARVLDVGELESGAPYIVSEYLDGSDLDAVIAARGPLKPAEAAGYLLQACAGMAEAHALGIIHRDLKPGNLFVTTRPDGSPLVKILDFGIAKAPAELTTKEFSNTDTQTVLGSPAFMSPEQMRSAKHVDPRTDIWALGAILYYLVTRSTPFPADTFPELCLKVLQEPPGPPPLELPGGLWDVISTCLEKRREDRYADCRALAAALAPHAEGSELVHMPRASAMPRAADPAGAGDRGAAAEPESASASSDSETRSAINLDTATSLPAVETADEPAHYRGQASGRLTTAAGKPREKAAAARGRADSSRAGPSRRHRRRRLALATALFVAGAGAFAGLSLALRSADSSTESAAESAAESGLEDSREGQPRAAPPGRPDNQPLVFYGPPAPSGDSEDGGSDPDTGRESAGAPGDDDSKIQATKPADTGSQAPGPQTGDQTGDQTAGDQADDDQTAGDQAADDQAGDDQAGDDQTADDRPRIDWTRQTRH